MTHQEKLEAIRKACVAANPEIIVEGRESGITPCACWWHKNYPPDGNKYRPIRLADVLLALHEAPRTKNVGITTLVGSMVLESFTKDDLRKEWNLYKDSLEEQSKETVAFIYDLLK